jgi:histidyl-tRNA synthetase
MRIEPIRSVKGTRDLLPPDTNLWQRVEAEAHLIFAAYHYGEVRTPILEETALFARSVGADTDIVMKEMYTFWESQSEDEQNLKDAKAQQILNAFRTRQYRFRTLDALAGQTKLNPTEIQETMDRNPSLFRKSLDRDASGRDLYALQAESVSLRPEATASVVRAYIEHSLYNQGGVHKLYYIGPMFRRERPQKGRYRQFYQIGAEVLGSQNPFVDAEVLEMLVLFLDRVGIREYQLLLNSVGCPTCRADYLKVLRAALEGVKASMCGDCQRRADTNPLRVLDCKVESDQPIIENLPKIIDHLDPECRRHFDRVTRELQARGLSYQVTPRLVRGLDYYTRTTFEITSGALGAQNAVVGGGRYDGLSEMLGGPPTPGIGFSVGLDRLILAVQAAAGLKSEAPLAAYIVWMGEAALPPAAGLARELRAQGMSVEIDYDPMKIKKAMGVASKLGARFAIIIGEGELSTGRYQVKDMGSGEQQEVAPGNIAAHLKEIMNGK